MFFVIVMMSIVSALDLGFGKLVFAVFVDGGDL
jgi:preprotein translocase subunit SecE